MCSIGLPNFPSFPISKQSGKLTFVEALVHTEGCAEGYGESALDGMRNYDRVSIGHMLHPFSRFMFLVEHGCEKSLLSYFDLHLREDYSVDSQSFGKASIQGDGGIDNTVRKVEHCATYHLGLALDRSDCAVASRTGGCGRNVCRRSRICTHD